MAAKKAAGTGGAYAKVKVRRKGVHAKSKCCGCSCHFILCCYRLRNNSVLDGHANFTSSNVDV